MGDALDQARKWRLAAADYRTTAEQTRNPLTRETFQRLAATYESLADRLDAPVEGRRSKTG